MWVCICDLYARSFIMLAALCTLNAFGTFLHLALSCVWVQVLVLHLFHCICFMGCFCLLTFLSLVRYRASGYYAM